MQHQDFDPAERRSYVVGLPVVVTVDKYGAVTLQVDVGELVNAISEEYPSDYDLQHLDQRTVDADVATIKRRIDNHTAPITYN